MLWHYDEPFNDFSYLPTYYVCESSRKYVTVALSGDGGDELFCGYPKYIRAVRVDRLNRTVPLSVRRPLLKFFYRMLPEWADSKRHVRRLASGVNEMVFDIMATGFMPEQMASLVQPELEGELSHYHPREAVERHLQLSSERDYTLINSLRYLDLKMTLAEDMLVKVDRASMAVSLEVRPMLLDIPLVELASHIPGRTLVSGQESKRVMKRAVEPLVPRENIYRKKMGFGIPLKVWFWGQLASYVEETRTSDTPFVNSGYFQKILDYHLRGRRDFTLQIHNIVFWHFWARRWGIA
jgi:asparagine synthase (glutamine-hydrolysing)